MRALLTETQQIGKTRKRTPIPQEFVEQQLARAGPALDINTETNAEEVLKRHPKLFGVAEARSTIRGDQVQRLQRLLVEVWRLRLDHFDSHDAKRPDVDFRTVLLLLHNLRGHPVWGTHHGRTLGFGFSEFGAESKVRYCRGQYSPFRTLTRGSTH